MLATPSRDWLLTLLIPLFFILLTFRWSLGGSGDMGSIWNGEITTVSQVSAINSSNLRQREKLEAV